MAVTILLYAIKYAAILKEIKYNAELLIAWKYEPHNNFIYMGVSTCLNNLEAVVDVQLLTCFDTGCVVLQGRWGTGWGAWGHGGNQYPHRFTVSQLHGPWEAGVLITSTLEPGLGHTR